MKTLKVIKIGGNIIDNEDAVLDIENSVVIKQANNRTYAAQIVLKQILEGLR